MGSYLCIASNSVPPSVSKRISLNIHCKYDFFAAGFILNFVKIMIQGWIWGLSQEREEDP